MHDDLFVPKKEERDIRAKKGSSRIASLKLKPAEIRKVVYACVSPDLLFPR